MMFLNPYRDVGGGLPTPISYWNFDANSNDQVGTNNGVDDLMLYNAGGVVDNRADFTSSTSSKISIPHNASLSFGSSPFSYSMWVKFDSIKNSWFMNKRATSGLVREYQLVYYLNGLYVSLFDSTNGGGIVTIFDWLPIINNWYHIGHTWAGGLSQPKLFLNGAEVGTAINSGVFENTQNSSSPLVFGKANFSNSYSLDGWMDETYLWNLELTNAQMLEAYNKGLNGEPLI